MKAFYKLDGQFDLSDEGKQAKDIENKIDFEILISHLPPKDQQIAKMISEGYTHREIAKELKVGRNRVRNIGAKLDKNMI